MKSELTYKISIVLGVISKQSVCLTDVQKNAAAIQLKERYSPEILSCVTKNTQVRNSQSHRLVLASLDAVLVVASDENDPNMNEFTFEADGYTITFNPKKDKQNNTEYLVNPDLELDPIDHGEILPLINDNTNYYTYPSSYNIEKEWVNIQLSPVACIPIDFTKDEFKKVYCGAQQCYGYRKSDNGRCKNRRRKDTLLLGIFCHHHTYQYKVFVRFKTEKEKLFKIDENTFYPDFWDDLHLLS
jgi:hypothetical protein